MYTINYRDEEGLDHMIAGGTLEALQEQLAEVGYEGSSIKVTNEPGFLVGWVDAKTWRYA